jgi:hypothetical protein
MKTKKIGNNKFKRSRNRVAGMDPINKSSSYSLRSLNSNNKNIASTKEETVSLRPKSDRSTRFIGSLNENAMLNASSNATLRATAARAKTPSRATATAARATATAARATATATRATTTLIARAKTPRPTTPSKSKSIPSKTPTSLSSKRKFDEVSSKQYGKWGENKMAELLVEPTKMKQHMSASNTQGVIDICEENIKKSNRPNINAAFQCKMSEKGKQAYELSDARQLWSYSLEIEKGVKDLYYILICYYSDDASNIREVVDVEQVLFDPNTYWGVNAFKKDNIDSINQMLEKNVADVAQYKKYRKQGLTDKARELKTSIEEDTLTFNKTIRNFKGLLRVYAKLSSPTSSGDHDNSRPWQIGTDSNTTKFMKVELKDVLFVDACIDPTDIARAKISASAKISAKGLEFGTKLDDKTFKNIVNKINVFLEKKCKKNKTRQNKKKYNKTRRKNKGKIKL